MLKILLLFAISLSLSLWSLYFIQHHILRTPQSILFNTRDNTDLHRQRAQDKKEITTHGICNFESQYHCRFSTH